MQETKSYRARGAGGGRHGGRPHRRGGDGRGEWGGHARHRRDGGRGTTGGPHHQPLPRSRRRLRHLPRPTPRTWSRGSHQTIEVEPEDYAPDEIDDESEEDYEHEGQLVTDPEDENEARHVEDLKTREDWEDDSYTSDSGYPRNDAYIDPDTGKMEVDPLLSDIEGVQARRGRSARWHEPGVATSEKASWS